MEEENNPSRKQRILGGLLAQLPAGTFQKNPYLPDLLNQPDVLIIPSQGRLAAVFLHGSSQRITWRSALAALEDLFEVKLHAGRNTTAVAIDLSEGTDDLARNDMRRLLSNTYDVFIRADFLKSEIRDGRFWAAIEESTARQELFHLWDMEREFVQTSLRRFNKERYRTLIDRERVPRLAKDVILGQVAAWIGETTGAYPVREPLVSSVKGSLGSLSGSYKLGFDLMATDPIETPIDIVRLGRYGSRDTVRYLMTKARLMRYAGETGHLERLWNRARPLLIVDGNLAGPDHDPFRYVRSLISVGWELMSNDARREIPRMLEDANI